LKVEPSQKVQSIGSYAFAEVDKMVAKLRAEGIEPIDFGVGDPQDPTPDFIRDAVKRSVDERKTSGYPDYVGSKEYRTAIAEWVQKRFKISLDPEKEICSSLGGKECVFNFAQGFVNPGDIVLCPNPGYPPASRGAIFAGGRPVYLPLLEENDFLIDLEAIDKEIIKKAKILWINYPSNPTGAVATDDFFKRVIDFGHDNNIIIASDEVYADIYYENPPRSILEFSREGVVSVYSLSKRSNMTAYRVGWITGDEEIISIFKKVKTNIDSGTPWIVQDAAIAALQDETHVQEMRIKYKKKFDVLCAALSDVGLIVQPPKATFYLWQKGRPGESSLDFAKKLLSKNLAIVTTPGAWISKEIDGVNPGEGFIRFAMVAPLEKVKEAADRIRTHFK